MLMGCGDMDKAGHRHPAARRVPQELGDPRVRRCIDEQGGRPMAQVMEAHGRQIRSPD
jgi:hypothetical protein